MKYYKLYANINPVENNIFYEVYNTKQYSHCKDGGLKAIKNKEKEYQKFFLDTHIVEVTEQRLKEVGK